MSITQGLQHLQFKDFGLSGCSASYWFDINMFLNNLPEKLKIKIDYSILENVLIAIYQCLQSWIANLQQLTYQEFYCFIQYKKWIENDK